MKTLFSLLIFAILLSPILVEKSYGQTQGTTGALPFSMADLGNAVTQLPPDTEIVVQSELYDSDGNFVGYTEGHPQIFNPDIVISQLALHAPKSTITKEGKSFEVLKLEDSVHWDRFTVEGAYFYGIQLNGKMLGLLYFSSDSFPISAGDTNKIFISVIRPLG